MKKTPRARLWIGSIKIGEKVSIGQVKKARGVIGHGVLFAGDKVASFHIAVESLVQRLLAQHRGGGRGCRDRAFAIPEEGAKVVSLGVNRALPHVETLSTDFVVQKGADQFQLGIIDRAVGVGAGGQEGAHLSRERDAPDDGGGVPLAQPMEFSRGFEDGHPSRSGRRGWGWEPEAGGVVGADERGVGGDEFLEAGGSCGKCVGEPTKIGQRVVKAGGEAQPARCAGFQGGLQVAEEAACPRDGQCHGAEFAQKLVVGGEGKAFFRRGNGVEQLLKPQEAACGKSDGHGDCVQDPAQNFFAGAPAGVTFQELAHGDRFGAGGGIGAGQGAEDGVDSVHEDAASVAQVAGGALSGGDKVVDEHVNGRQAAVMER